MGFAREYLRQLDSKATGASEGPKVLSAEEVAAKKQKEKEAKKIQHKAEEFWQEILAKKGSEEVVLKRVEEKIKSLHSLADDLKKGQTCRIKGLEGFTAGDLADLAFSLEGKRDFGGQI